MTEAFSAFIERVSGNTEFTLGSNFALDPERKKLIENLPTITEEQLVSLDHKDSSCPICYTSFLAVLASEEMAHAMESPAVSFEDLGVTRLADTCGHLFCRKDITTWIRQNNTCPTCRTPFITVPDHLRHDSGDSMLELLARSDDDRQAIESMEVLMQSQQNRDLLERVFSLGILTPERRNERENISENHPTESHPSTNEEDDDRREFSGMYS